MKKRWILVLGICLLFFPVSIDAGETSPKDGKIYQGAQTDIAFQVTRTYEKKRWMEMRLGSGDLFKIQTDDTGIITMKEGTTKDGEIYRKAQKKVTFQVYHSDDGIVWMTMQFGNGKQFEIKTDYENAAIMMEDGEFNEVQEWP